MVLNSLAPPEQKLAREALAYLCLTIVNMILRQNLNGVKIRKVRNRNPSLGPRCKGTTVARTNAEMQMVTSRLARRSDSTNALSFHNRIARAQSWRIFHMHINGTRVFPGSCTNGIIMVNGNAISHCPHPVARIRMIVVLNERNHAICERINTMILIFVSSVNGRVIIIIANMRIVASRQFAANRGIDIIPIRTLSASGIASTATAVGFLNLLPLLIRVSVA